MSTTIDAAGRLVVPKAVRDAAGLRPGTELEIRFRGGRIEIEPKAVEVTIVDRGGVAVAVPAAPIEPLTAETVRRVQESDRDDRG